MEMVVLGTVRPSGVAWETELGLVRSLNLDFILILSAARFQIILRSLEVLF